MIFDWKATYNENKAEAQDYMIFYNKIAIKEKWYIVRGWI